MSTKMETTIHRLLFKKKRYSMIIFNRLLKLFIPILTLWTTSYVRLKSYYALCSFTLAAKSRFNTLAFRHEIIKHVIKTIKTYFAI